MKIFINTLKFLWELLFWLFIGAFMVIGSMLVAIEARADDVKLHLNVLPVSHHHGNSMATNERHKGVGLSATVSNGASFGIMHFKNSFGDKGFMLSVAKQKMDCVVCPGVGVGYAPAYTKSGNDPILGWVSIKYKWVSILSAPGEVTAVILSVPLN